MTDRLAGKVAIVTGGAGGIGWSIAGRFLAEGGRVAIADIIEPAAGLTNGESLFISCDLRSAKQIGHMATRTIDRFGRIDILVNNAGKAGGSGINHGDMGIGAGAHPLPFPLVQLARRSKAPVRIGQSVMEIVPR